MGMELYAEYLKAATGAKLVQNKNGFAVCRPLGQELYVAEFFAKNAFDAVAIFRLVHKEAINNRCLIISAHVENYFPRAKALLKLFTRLGFEILSVHPDRTAIFYRVEKISKWERAEAGEFSALLAQ